MAKIYKASLLNANRKAGSLDTIAFSAKKMKESIDSFISNSYDKLEGGGFDALRKKLSYYSLLYGLIVNLCDTTTNNCISVNNSMYNFMEGYSSLDDSRLDEINYRLYLIYKEITECEKSGLTDDIEPLKHQYKRLADEAEKLKELKPTDNALYGKLDKTLSDISKTKSEINNLKVTQISEDYRV